MEEPTSAQAVTIRYLEEHPGLSSPAAPGAEGRDPITASALAALLEAERRRTLAPPRIGTTGEGDRRLSPWQNALRGGQGGMDRAP
jgi:hypothetical protein